MEPYANIDNNYANTNLKSINLIKITTPVLISNQFTQNTSNNILTNSEIENILKPMKLLNYNTSSPSSVPSLSAQEIIPPENTNNQTILLSNSQTVYFNNSENAIFSKYYAPGNFVFANNSEFENKAFFLTKCSFNTQFIKDCYDALNIKTS